MKYCKKCSVTVTDDSKICPLCQHSLTDDMTPTEPVFPYIPLKLNKKLIYIKLGIFISIAMCIISLIVDVIIFSHITWSMYVLGGAVSLWIISAVFLPRIKNIPKNVLYQAVVLSVLAYIWDKFTGDHGWAVTFVIPFCCTGTNITLITVFFILKFRVDDVAFYYCANLIYGFLPIFFILTGKLSVLYPSLISIGISSISLTAFLIFYWDNIVEVLKSKFHI